MDGWSVTVVFLKFISNFTAGWADTPGALLTSWQPECKKDKNKILWLTSRSTLYMWRKCGSTSVRHERCLLFCCMKTGRVLICWVRCQWYFLTVVLPVMTSFPAVALSLVSPVRRCLVRHLYVLKPSSGLTLRICSSPDGRTTYLPSKRLHNRLGSVG